MRDDATIKRSSNVNFTDLLNLKNIFGYEQTNSDTLIKSNEPILDALNKPKNSVASHISTQKRIHVHFPNPDCFQRAYLKILPAKH